MVWFWKVKVEAKELNERMRICNQTARVRFLHHTALKAVVFVIVKYWMCARMSTVTNVGKISPLAILTDSGFLSLCKGQPRRLTKVYEMKFPPAPESMSAVH